MLYLHNDVTYLSDILDWSVIVHLVNTLTLVS